MGPNLPKSCISGQKRKKWTSPLNSWGLSTKFQFKPTIWIVWTKFAQKGYFWSKTKNLHFRVRTSMVVTYYIKLFRTGAERHNSILMSLLLLVTETINLWILYNGRPARKYILSLWLLVFWLEIRRILLTSFHGWQFQKCTVQKNEAFH